MFDLNASDGSVRRKAYESPIPETPEAKQRPMAGNRLDSGKMQALHKRLLDHYQRELDRQFDNRMEMAIDEDFYDNIQWTEEDAAQLRERGQMPLVYNVISASVDWVTGTEKRSRTDYKILPRRKEDAKPAERKSQILKYLSDANRTPFALSRSFSDAVIAGLGWIEDGVTDDDEREPIYSRYENWRNVLHDSSATELDLSDARYVIRTKWVDLDVAQAMFPKRAPLLAESVDAPESGGFLDLFGDEAMDSQEIDLDENFGSSRSESATEGYQRQRVRLIEMWIRLPVQATKMSGGTFGGELYDQGSRGHDGELQRGEAKTVEKMTMRMHCAIFTTCGMLWFGPSPYRHNRFPLTPIWGFRRRRNGLPYGLIRRIRDIQQDVNKRASKALHILSTSKVIMDEGAVPDIDAFQEEVARPDAVIVKKPGKELIINADRDLSQWHLELMSRSISMIQQGSGVTDELLGRTTNAVSGVAVQRRQDQGSLATSTLFDNLRFARQIRGENQLSLAEQFITEKKAFRITNMRGTPDYITVNDGLPENDIARAKADFVIDEADWNASIRQAAVAELLDVLSKLAPVAPQLVMVLLDLIIENMDLPNREEIVKRVRAITGQRDPDADEPTPEELEREEAKVQAEQAEQKMQQATLEAQLRKAVADAAKSEADAAKSAAQAQQLAAKIVGDNVDAQKAALDAARQALEVPAAAHVADHILSEAGFVSKTEKEQAAARTQAMAARVAAQQAQAQQQQPQQPA